MRSSQVSLRLFPYIGTFDTGYGCGLQVFMVCCMVAVLSKGLPRIGGVVSQLAFCGSRLALRAQA